MNLQAIISELKKERDRLDRAIAALDETSGTGRAITKRRRPPAAKSATAGRGSSTKSRLTSAGRKRLSELMKQRWAQRRKKAASGRKAA
jgi:ABC-type transporter Mla subunit MlaD